MKLTSSETSLPLSIQRRTLTTTKSMKPVSNTLTETSFLPAHPASILLTFQGRYTPKAETLASLKMALNGWPDSKGLLAPSYFPTEELTQALSNYLNTPETQPSNELIHNLAHYRQRISNYHALLTEQPIQNIESFQEEAQNFLSVLQEQYQLSTSDQLERFQFSSEMHAVYTEFVSQTAPILWGMGFADAIQHAGQVSRLAIIKAAEGEEGQEQATPLELLQAGLVGWLHDPKLPGAISWENLAAHPIIASAIAEEVLSKPTLKHALSKLPFKTAKANPNSVRLQDFTRGITEALSINNDSRFIVDQVILSGILKQVKTIHDRPLLEQLKNEWSARISAPSRGKQPKPLSKPLLGLLHNITLDTGLIALQTESLASRHQGAEVTNTSTRKAFNALLEGQTTTQFSQQEIQNAHYRITIDAKTLLSHHDEVCPSGKKAAQALVSADPLLLSPYKVFMVRDAKEPLLKKVHSFLASFENNINDLPKAAQANARPWQYAVLASIKLAAHYVNEVVSPDDPIPHETLLWDPKTAPTGLDTLKQELLSDTLWKDYASEESWDDEKNQQVAHALGQAYQLVCKTFRDIAFQQATS